jgi:phosphoribosylamine--glycine ligase
MKTDDTDALLDFAKYEWIDLTVVGPEVPLTAGIVDAFKKENRRIFGPDKTGAQLEGSKVFAKDFMRTYGIPTAEYKTFTSYLHAEEYVRLKGAPLVIKADGLAAGKGVIVTESVEEAIDALKLIMRKKAFGSAGDRVIVEQCLRGEEASFMVLTDGKTVLPLVTSQDHKTVFDNDKGPNTGGMGAYSPAPVITKGLEKDPEAQPVLMRLKSDLFDALKATADGRLNDVKLSWRKDTSVCVVLASKGYPGSYEKGKTINGLDSVKGRDNLMVFHAGTDMNNGNFVTSGGRVLGVTALGKDAREAKTTAYKAIRKIHFEGMHYRKDIADKAIKR